jgi:HK97 family phage major capsid protein
MDIIPYLNVQPVVGQLGATTMANLSGKVSFPRNSNAITMGWKTEGSASDEKSLTFDEVTLTAKELTGHGVLSNSLLRQSTNMSSFVQQTFQNAIAIALDAAAINGSGSAGQPTGILNTSGIGSVVGGTNGAVPDWTDVVDLLKEVEIDNALLENLHYLSTPQIKALFSRTGKQSSGVEGNFIMTNPKELNGYPFTASNNVPSTLTKGTSSGNCHAIIFGNFAELMIGTWGGVEIMVNPYSLDTTRQTRITVSLFADIAVRHAQSFAAMKDALLS